MSEQFFDQCHAIFQDRTGIEESTLDVLDVPPSQYLRFLYGGTELWRIAKIAIGRRPENLHKHIPINLNVNRATFRTRVDIAAALSSMPPNALTDPSLSLRALESTMREIDQSPESVRCMRQRPSNEVLMAECHRRNLEAIFRIDDVTTKGLHKLLQLHR